MTVHLLNNKKTHVYILLNMISIIIHRDVTHKSESTPFCGSTYSTLFLGNLVFSSELLLISLYLVIFAP